MKIEEVKQQLAKLIDKHIVEKRQKESYLTNHFRGSGITECPRALLFSMMNLDNEEYPKANRDSAQGFKLMDHGTAIHRMIQGYLAEMKLLKEEDSEKRMEDESLLFAGHCDGVLSLDKRVLLEIKTINSYGFRMLSTPKEGHFYQAQAYAYFMNKLYGDSIEEILFLYIDRNSDNLDMKEYWVPVDKITSETIINKLNILKQLLIKQEIYPIPVGYNPDDSKFSPCKWCAFNTKQLCKSKSISMQDYPNRKIVAKI